ncbi:4-hydroxy-tetrahydrodipicolinate synthase [Photobacterium sp. TY1-4]|uniref:4-hydroxy-tetrahydrodipicolinate synthase n=1 Tax=Photobacterium sp. TY1-4 TaxID=2899122 RepID=UPI0021C13170|nr:4-hydroxy-tetrahydrodipicolinate synthase [Photobacterium sp. TY1-4]UXI02437.1 4-hydroxy-tetrahydrodipicolinate synthase [Photobacterium sp. TY1-4]
MTFGLEMPIHNSCPTTEHLVSPQATSLNQTTLWTALITPFHDDESVDFETLTQLATEQDAVGNGILLLGSTGEALAMTPTEQQAVVRHVCALELSAPLMVGVGGFQLQQQLQWLTFLADYPIDALLLPVPLYAKPGAASQQKWFEALLDASRWPCMIYNVPSRTGAALDAQTLGAISAHPNAWAVKEASGSVEVFTRYTQAAPTLQFFCGDDALFVDFAAAGACGLVSVAGNAWPEATALYVRQTLSQTASSVQQVPSFQQEPNFQQEPSFKQLWQSAGNSLFCAANPIAVKALMQHQGRLRHAGLRPPLYMDELPELTPVLNANHDINQWMHSCQDQS